MYEALSAMASVMLDPYLLLLIFVTTIGGIVIGVLPGLGATTGAALLLPFTLTMSPVHAIAVLATLYVSATFAGSITAILINTPGTSAAAATTFDGFPLAQRGEAGRALGIAVVASTIGGIFSIIVLCFAAPMLARVAYEFRPPEYFALTIFGLSMLASVGAGGAVRNLIGGIFGVWLATIGAERVTSIERFMFGNYELYEGLSFVPVMIGLFAISELLVQSKKAHLVAEVISLKAVKLPSREDYRRIWRTIVRSSGIGTFIGILPAEGATVASMIGYSEARRWSKNKEEFGKGAVEGIAGAEAANNACNGWGDGANNGSGHSRQWHNSDHSRRVDGAWPASGPLSVYRAGRHGLPDFWSDACCQHHFPGDGPLCGKAVCAHLDGANLDPVADCLCLVGDWCLRVERVIA
jgi:putative tricarboxylic transport membrane protein